MFVPAVPLFPFAPLAAPPWPAELVCVYVVTVNVSFVSGSVSFPRISPVWSPVASLLFELLSASLADAPFATVNVLPSWT